MSLFSFADIYCRLFPEVSARGTPRRREENAAEQQRLALSSGFSKLVAVCCSVFKVKLFAFLEGILY